jgi:GNAT superfamily N-acetyltransferase
MNEKLKLRTIEFSQWRREIAPLWLMDGSYRFIHQTINGHGQMQYIGKETVGNILLFPIAAELEGERVGWTSVYNISAEAVRVRGIYVLPEFRSSGIGYAMVQCAMSLWPPPWKRCFMYARASNVQRYLRWGFVVAPGHAVRSWPYGKQLNDAEIVLMQKPLPEERGRLGQAQNVAPAEALDPVQ